MSAPAPPLPGPVAARFTVTTVAADDPGWWPAAGVLVPGGRLATLVAGERAARGAPSDAVAGSLLVLEYARLLGWPVLGAAVRRGCWPDPAAVQVRLAVVDGRLGRVGFAGGRECRGGAREALAALLDRHLGSLVAAVHARTRAPLRTLWGDVAAATAGALLALSWTMPDRAGLVAATRAVLDAEPRLCGLVAVTASGVASGPAGAECEEWMRAARRSCCLAFRCAPPHGHWCGTCPVLGEEDRLRRFRDAAARYRTLEARA